MTPQPKKRHVGFRAMAPHRHKQIAAQGGAMAHKLRHAHQWTPEEARDAGRKGRHGPVEEPSIRDAQRLAAVSPHAPSAATP
jgi:hypothetical protein